MDRSPADRILEEWNAVTDQARRPRSAPRRSTVRGGLAGAGLAGASLLVIGALIAVVWLGRPGSGPTGVSASAVELAERDADRDALAESEPVADAVGQPGRDAHRRRRRRPRSRRRPPRRPAHRRTSPPGSRCGKAPPAAGSRTSRSPTPDRPAASWRPWTGRSSSTGKGPSSSTGPLQVTSPTLTIAPGGVLKTLVRASNYCGPTPLPPDERRVRRSDGRFQATPVSPTDATVPPCNGDPGRPAASTCSRGHREARS